MLKEMWYTVRNPNFIKSFLFFFIVIPAIKMNAQVNEPARYGVYDYLYRMAQKGLIRWNDYQLPLERRDISLAIKKLSENQDHLSGIEVKELNFYKQEYSFDLLDSTSKERTLFAKDTSGRWRTARFDKGLTRIFIDPLVGFRYLRADDKNSLQYFSGVRVAGYFGERWGFNFSFRDNTERGDTLTHASSFSPVETVVPTIKGDRLINYSNLNYNIGYRWHNGSLSVGQENLSWGYGLSGNVALSGRAPSFPFIRFDFDPWRWLHFSYFHGWLQSDIIDSARSYNTGSGIFDSRRDVYFPKFIAHHSITVTPFKGLDVAIGESMIYSDRLNIAYLIPVNFFKIYDQLNSRYNIRGGDNSQFFGFISSRNQIRNTHVYAQVFIDEIRASKIFNKTDRRNQLGYTLGINRTDLFLNYLTAGIEYSRVNPFVYNNLIPTQTYENQSYALGDWMGNNADRFCAFVQYVPLPRLRLKLSYQKLRKGESGSLYQQYLQQPQPPFLFKKLFDYDEAGFAARYEVINRLVLLMELNKINIKYVNASPIDQKGLKFGLSYGL